MPDMDLSGVREASTVEAPHGVAKGGRDDALMRYACALQALGVPDDEMDALVLAANSTFDPPLSESQALKCSMSAQRYEKGTAGAHAPAPRRMTPIEAPRLRRVGRPDLLGDWRCVPAITQARAWVKSLFRPADVVCVVWDVAAGAAGEVHALAGQLADPHDPLMGDVLAMAGDGGLWAVVNPLDGSGRRRAGNVAAYRNLLVESDDLPPHEQLERMCALLKGASPRARTITWSGGKSMHAVVRVDVRDADEYAQRRDWVYALCERNGLPVDRHCGNPTRLTRMPGGMRGENMQSLASADEPDACWDGTPSTWAMPR